MTISKNKWIFLRRHSSKIKQILGKNKKNWGGGIHLKILNKVHKC